MALEFLYALEDIPSLVFFLYENGYYISKGKDLQSNRLLTPNDAISALSTDLLLPGSKVYWIGQGEQRFVLQFISCGNQSHPCCLGREGRAAALLSSRSQSGLKESADKLQKILRGYLKKNGSFLPYNGKARMSCYFLHNYLALEEDYLCTPFNDPICRGVIRVLCSQMQVNTVTENLGRIAKQYPAIVPGRMHIFTNWGNHEVADICFEFLCDRSNFSFSDLHNLIRWLSGNRKSEASNQKLRMMANCPPMRSLPSHVEQPIITVFIENPWQSWLGSEEHYSGKLVTLWPEKNM